MSASGYSQEGRLISIETTLGTTDLVLEKFTGFEALSRPFEFQVNLLSEDQAVDMKSLLRTEATVSLLQHDGSTRKFHGIFRSFRQGSEEEPADTGSSDDDSDGAGQKLTAYSGVLVPKVWFLSLDSKCRIFQNKTAQDIINQLLDDASVTYEWVGSPSFPTREYCVQYRESTFNFISRLLEEEGEFYFFRHDDSGHTMVFADKSATQEKCPGQETATYSYAQSGKTEDGDDGVAVLDRVEQAYTGQVALGDYCFLHPSLDLNVNQGSVNEEAYDYPGGHGYLHQGDSHDLDQGPRYAGLRMDECGAEQFMVVGAGICRPFRPGHLFTLQGHYRDDTNQDYFLTAVTHVAEDTTYRSGSSAPVTYRNEFKAIPKTIPYRPPRVTRKPVVQGPQSALVVGKASEEIWVDNYGRVKVQFYWDREGKKDENSSCWIRVSQIWAGKNWGWITIPRIGQEVVVDFLEGDPDRPIITGRVYNAEQMPPYTLNANQTQSGIKTRSSKQGTTDNYNEIQFEDLKGSEKISVHAEKDMDTTVEHDDTQTIQNNRTITVSGTHTETITKDTTIEITEGNHSLTIDKGNQTITVTTGNQTIKVSLGKIDTTAMVSITMTVGPSSIKIDPTGVTIAAPKITLQAEATVEITAGATISETAGMILLNS